MSDMTAPNQQSIDEFLGSDDRPVWQRWAKIWIPLLVLLAILVAAIWYTRDSRKPQYVTTEVTRKSLDVEVNATGNLRPTNQVEVGSEVSGKIDAIYVDVNDRVTQGQVLARINTDVIDDQIKQAVAGLQSARASVAQAQATLTVDTAQLARLQEVSRLSGGKVPSKSEMEVAQANVARDRASLAAAQANASSAAAQLSTAQTNKSRAIIVSPVSGVVLARQVEPGQTVAASFSTPTLFVLAQDLSQMQLRVSVDEADVGQVKAGQKASFTVDAYPGRRFPAQVERINLGSNNTATAAAATTTQASQVVVYEARLTVANPEGLLRPGMTATANIATATTGVQMLVPNGALRFKPGATGPGGGNALNPQIGLQQEEQKASIGVGSSQQIYVLDEGGNLKAIKVTTGQSDGRLTVVRSSELKPGMKVVTGVKASGK
ncbi:MAG: efflux RND transporter periplasmic adaptor subunit [Candidatus Andeanibacterium colombiense]|uniref:Efflux RND transporter periplasmic adaptor subunit n=1 Tax=Candidatus Andeanibacterium colombiense TaxID=3121345 RepID=A0AAJ6BPN6_9SPHN|nr:MAG: efflux RND transporter periplasmic adaptor subunit [Sphingomonadaceae bacterium]